jgi:hypothetical protein
MEGPDSVLMDTTRQEEEMTRQKLPIGLAEIAGMFMVEKNTPAKWLYRSRLGQMDPPMPEPDGHVSATVPYWWDATIKSWARSSRRTIRRLPAPGGAWLEVAGPRGGEEVPDDLAGLDVLEDAVRA